MMTDCFEQLAEEAGNLTRLSKRVTLTAREVQVGQGGVGECLGVMGIVLCLGFLAYPVSEPPVDAACACPPSRAQTAVRLALPGELGRHAIQEGKKAVLKTAQ